ncbi:protein polyglycylase TTLL10-like [Mobula birostris]|uniref:protein polyglycylase TTLL10-like n=1 Tax=Mobula birostris TaxID=1983395 RepID=UPI003B28244E
MALTPDENYYSNTRELQNHLLSSPLHFPEVKQRQRSTGLWAASSFTDPKAIDGVSSKTARHRRLLGLRDHGPFFYVGGSNGADLVANYCEIKGWKRIYDNNRGDYLFKWSEHKMATNYQNFQPGRQILSQIPNNRILTTKVGLCTSLKEYERIAMRYSKGVNSHKTIKLGEFFPESYCMDVKSERQAFFDAYKAGQIWICKPGNLQEGRGIFLLRSRNDVKVLREKLQSVEDNPLLKPTQYNSIVHRVVQRYISRPLLLDGRKFDVRSFFLIACTSPYMAFFHHGYAKSTCNVYSPASDDLTTHLTNQFIQRKNPRYKDMKEDTIWSMERLNDYINERYMESKHLPKDWVFIDFTRRMQEIMKTCLNCAKTKLDSKLGFFDLMGCDFIIDQNFKVWLLEINANPSLQRHSSVLQSLIPRLVYETLDVVIEIFKKSRKGLLTLPLESQREFVLIYNGMQRGQKSIPGIEDKISPMFLKQTSQPKCLVKNPVRKQEESRLMSDHDEVERESLLKVSSPPPGGQLPSITKIQSLSCMKHMVKANNPPSASQTAYLKEWRTEAEGLMIPMSAVPPFNRKFTQIPQKSTSLESNLFLK